MTPTIEYNRIQLQKQDTYRLQLQCLIFNYSMLLLADVSIPPCMECQSLAAVVWLLISSGQPTVTHSLVAVYISGWREVLGRCSVLTQWTWPVLEPMCFNQTLFFFHIHSNITFFCFRLPEVLRIFDYQSDELMSNLLTELERVKQEGENYWLSKVQYLFVY